MTLAASASQATMTAYFEGLGKLLGRVERRASFAPYAAGLLSELERKSVEPIAALAPEGDPKRCALVHDRLLHLLNTSPRSDEDVRAYAAEYALRALTKDECVEAWSVDDTGFLKQGDDSVGVRRQYAGTAGKVANCQVAVSLTVATRSVPLPVDMALCLPAVWAEDQARREAARVPASVRFQTKHDLALGLLAKALLAGVPRGGLLADNAYGSSARLRGEATALGFAYALGVVSSVVVRRIDALGRRRAPSSVKALALGLRAAAWREGTWLEGTKSALRSRFALVEVAVENADPNEPARQRLLIEWPEGQEAPTHSTLVTLPASAGLLELVRMTKARRRRESTGCSGRLSRRSFRSLKGWVSVSDGGGAAAVQRDDGKGGERARRAACFERRAVGAAKGLLLLFCAYLCQATIHQSFLSFRGACARGAAGACGQARAAGLGGREGAPGLGRGVGRSIGRGALAKNRRARAMSQAARNKVTGNDTDLAPLTSPAESLSLLQEKCHGM